MLVWTLEFFDRFSVYIQQVAMVLFEVFGD